MSDLFNPEAPLMRGLSTLVDIVLLNILTVLCSIPIVTAGAAVTALYDAMGRLIRDEGGIYRAYFAAFKSNFKQATIMWLLTLVIGAALIFSLIFYVVNGMLAVVALAAVLVLLWSMTVSWVFPLQARFENPVKVTIKNALLCGIAYFPRSLVMMALNLLPLVLALFVTSKFLEISFIWFSVWFGMTAYVSTMLLRKPFNRIMGVEDEKKPEESEEEE